MEHKAGKRKAIKFFEDNYTMIHSLQSQNEQGCATKCLQILKKSCDEDLARKYAEYEALEKKFIAYTGMNLKDWLNHVTKQ